MKILIVDDHELIREGLLKVLSKEVDIEEILAAEDTNQMFDVLSQNEVEAIILDISLPGRSGLDVIAQLKKSYPSVKILILSMHPEERFALRAFKAGAHGYLTKESAAKELVNALRKVINGGKYISEKMAEQLLNEIDSPNNGPLHESLSNRELEVLILIAKGKTVSKIAEELLLSVNTVTSYRSRLMEKMNMNTNAELIRYAIENNLI